MHATARERRGSSRRYQYSMRALLALTVVASILAAYVGYQRRLADQQHKAVKSLARLGIQIEWTEFNRRPRWLQHILGDDSYGASRTLHVHPVPQGDPDRRGAAIAEDLELFLHLKLVFVHDPEFGDEDLYQLRNLTSVRHLYLSHTQVSDAGMKHLAGLRHISDLDLCATDITDAALKEIRLLPELERLNLTVTRVSDSGMKEVAKMGSLRSLTLSRTQVSDVGIAELYGMKRLRYVDAEQTNVSEAALKKLKESLPEVAADSKNAPSE